MISALARLIGADHTGPLPVVIQKGSGTHRNYRILGYGLLLVIMLLLPFILPEFQVTRLNRTIAMAVAILGLNLVLGYSGLFALCQSAFIALGAFTSGSLIMDHGWDYWMTIPLGMFVAFLVGLGLGVPALKIKGLYLAMTTVAFAAAFPSLTKLEFFGIPERTGGANGREITEKMDPPSWMPIFTDTEPGRYRYFPIAILGILAFWAVGNLVKSRPGRAVVAIRDNEIGAAVSGVDLRRFKVLNFGLSAAIGGLAGVMWAMNSGFVAEQDFTFILMVDLLVGLVVGGVATISGAAVGAVVVVFGRWLCQTYFDYSMSSMIWLFLVITLAVFLSRQQTTGLRKFLTAAGTVIAGSLIGIALFAAVDVPGLYQLNGDGPLSQAIFGIVLISFVFFAPQGIIGAWRKVWSRLFFIAPVPPALAADAEILVNDVAGLTAEIDAATP